MRSYPPPLNLPYDASTSGHERREACRFLSVRMGARGRAPVLRYGKIRPSAGRRGRAFSWLNVWRVKPSGGHDYGRARRSAKTSPRGTRCVHVLHQSDEDVSRPAFLSFIRSGVSGRGGVTTRPPNPSPILMMPGAHAFLWCVLSSAHPGGGPLRNPMADAPKTLVSINA